ncbi:CHAT domain-containing protein [Sphaerospermopsis torques-reginae]|uniref:CHAT domain-containing protein n=1 Tax=Sphaerospermopsis torques-reginae ITEP-024 TaxID=984208 RepID=A0ABX8WWX8_9CYAN|nr:CHAT domain-containing tetratricopeptide repeat protein [Sphaerospermopsis torques-reginae]QYX30935.1 CHAT domain-containing protein [Sphaerospermopsis torques-reginae ITEP-024]
MDKQRLQAYYQLIQQLLSCADGEESAILQANTELLDADFLQLLKEGVAQMSTQEGQENRANKLMFLESQLSEYLNISLEENTPETETPVNEADIETYLPFLQQVLKTTAESRGNPQEVYPLLAANTDKLNLTFAKVLQVWATTTIAEAKPDTAKDIFRFSNRIQEFPLGNKANNLEIAITGYEICSTVFTRNSSPESWAAVKNNLATAYSDRIRGDKAENLEYAIAAYKEALEVRTRNDFPVDWAMTQNNLGNAYSDRIRGDKAENLENAIAAYKEALEVYTRNDFPVDWAMTQNNLGNAYSDRIRGDKAENLENAIAAYKEALEVRTRNDFPVDWAMTQNNLGNAYSDRIRGDKAENLENAIAAYKEALEVYTRNDFPVDWAMTQNNLGNAYLNRIRRDKAENLEYAIAAYKEALEVYTRNDFPLNNAGTLLNLGIAYQDSQQLNLAYDTFTEAIITVENIRGEIISGEESKRKQAEEWNKLYRRMVEVCLGLSRETEAISYIERSKTRNLVELIFNRDLKTIFPAEIVPQLEKLRDEIATKQNLLQTGKAENTTSLVQHLQQLRQKLQKLQDEYLPIGSSFEFTSLQKIVDQKTTIIEWYIAINKFFAVVIQPGGKQIKIWQSSSADFDSLFNWNEKYVNDYKENKELWENELDDNLQNLAQILHLEEILNLVPSECEKLILIPHRFLHLFPLHALPVRNSYLMDLFPQGVGYVPSCQLLQQLQLRQCNDFQSLFAMQTPTEDLYEKDLGAVAAIKQQFKKSDIFKKDKAKKSAESAIIQNPENLKTAHNLFFFCHGYFNSNSPLDSGLILADEVLTLADIIAHIKLENCRLVTLAACESGMIDGYNISDEYLGLPSGFLLAGSTNVVSSLWTVSIISTALLMVRFYEELKEQNNIVLALKTAQIWLRDTSITGFKQWLQTSSLSFVWQVEISKHFDIIEQNNGENHQPFSSPVYWSAFCCIGKGV